ncbi:Organic cation transporter protein [Penaeus vannamei]|uniref:Organic cation transporter protein n=1 Tax=Penaeus vannamei TaxID=6689 RepID=A0A423TEK6_PENVA|nr:Organic cation transporter protein [Penaeus vannamei]
MAKRLDDVMSRLGTGRWNLLHILSLSYCFSLTTYHTLGGAFLAPRVDYTCRRPEGAHDAAAARSASPLFIPAGDNTSEEAKPECSYFVLNSSSGQVEEEPCVEWDFDNSTFSSTVGTEVIFDSDRLVSGVGACDLAVTKFQLACGWEYLRSTYQSIYMFGVTIGAPFNGVLADRYGRKMTVAVGFVAYSTLAIGSCWIPNLSALLLSRFLMGAVHPTIQKTGYILAASLSIIHLLPSSPLSHLLFSSSSPPPSPPPLDYPIRFMDESPRWLAVRGQHRRALRVLQRAARWNGVALPPEDELLLLLKDGPVHQLPTGGCCVLRLSLSGGDLSSDPFLYMVLTGVVELPAYTLVIPWWLATAGGLPLSPSSSWAPWLFSLCPSCPRWGIDDLSAYGEDEYRFGLPDPRLLLLRALSHRGPLVPVGAVSSVRGGVGARGLATLALPETLHVPLPDTIAHLEEREIRTSGFLRLPVRDPRIPTIYVSQGIPGDSTPRGGIPLLGDSTVGDSTPRGFHSKGIPLQGIPLLGDSTPRGFQGQGIPLQGDSTPRGFHS